MPDPPRSHHRASTSGGLALLRALLLFAAVLASLPALANATGVSPAPSITASVRAHPTTDDDPTASDAPPPALDQSPDEARREVPPPDAPREQLRAYKSEQAPTSTPKEFDSAVQPDPDAASSDADGGARLAERRRQRAFALLVGASAGVGLPTKSAELRSDTQRVVAGFSGGPPSVWVAGTVPLSATWELMVRFGGQFAWAPHSLTFTPSAELRARAFPGVPSGPWEAFFTMGVGYGMHHHMVQADETVGEEPVRVRALQRADSGPFRIVGGMGARWNSRGRVMVEIDVLPYVFVPKWSFHLEFALSVGVKL